MSHSNILKIARDFSRNPGPRYRSEGENSGELFRESILFQRFEDARKKNMRLLIDLDGTAGFGTSFLEEVFGGLIREDGVALSDFRSVVELKSTEEPGLIKEINGYLEKAEAKRKK